MIYNLSKHNSIVNHFLAELRDVNIQQDRLRFRRNLERIGEVIAYNISEYLEYEEAEIETPLGIANTFLLKQQPVLATILRAGLPFHQGFLNIFDRADNAFISAYRRHSKDGSFKIKLEYVAAPNLEGKTLILADPMLATGASMVATLKSLIEEVGQPKVIYIATVIAAQEGIDYVQRMFPDAQIWAGAIDEELTAKSYIVPGLGDAGDLAFGDKLRD